MVDFDTLRRLVLALPETRDDSTPERPAFSVAGKGMAWAWNERVHPRKPRVPRPRVLAVRCAMEAKEMLMEAAQDRFFQDDHYRGYGAVLVRLDVVEVDELAALLKAAWAIVAPPALARRTRLD